MSQPTAAVPQPGFTPPAPKRKRRWPWIVASAAGVLVLLGIIGGIAAALSSPSKPTASKPPAAASAAATTALDLSTPEGIRQAVQTKAGRTCENLTPVAEPIGATARSSCQAARGEVVISTYATQQAAEAQFATMAATLRGISDVHVATGDKWTISGSDREYIQIAAEALGGRFDTRPKVVETTPAAPVSAKPAPAVTHVIEVVTVEDGVWTVGDDIPAGTYKVTTPVTEGCYWAIYKSGTNQSDIINNGLPSGGFPRVTINKGQDFETNGCGTWRKIR